MHETSIWSVGLFALLASAIILLALLKKISLTLCQCLPIFRIFNRFIQPGAFVVLKATDILRY